MVMSKSFKTHSVFVGVLACILVYILLYDYNATTNKTLNLTDISTSIKCISYICIEYNEIKECIYIHVPTLFRIETDTDINHLNSAVSVVDYVAIKEGCK
jgi:hypothetical protein